VLYLSSQTEIIGLKRETENAGDGRFAMIIAVDFQKILLQRLSQ
jgi:hypothetical protein